MAEGCRARRHPDAVADYKLKQSCRRIRVLIGSLRLPSVPPSVSTASVPSVWWERLSLSKAYVWHTISLISGSSVGIESGAGPIAGVRSNRSVRRLPLPPGPPAIATGLYGCPGTPRGGRRPHPGIVGNAPGFSKSAAGSIVSVGAFTVPLANRRECSPVARCCRFSPTAGGASRACRVSLAAAARPAVPMAG